LRLSKDASSLLAWGLGILILGILFGNIALLYLGSVPMMFLVLTLTVGKSVELTMEPTSSPLNVMVGDEIELTRDVIITGGAGLVTVREELPEYFKLVSGSNVGLLLKGPSDESLRLSYRVECTRRGAYSLSGLEYQVRQGFGFQEPKTGKLPIEQVITVQPQSITLRKVREKRKATLLPSTAESQIGMGVDTTDFKEMRKYGFGDSYKKINWKATSRSVTASGLLPIVNEYEKEGRSVAYIFLNCGTGMQAGSSLRNGFEYGVQAALGLAQYYVDAQGVVGFSLYNEDTPFISRATTPQKPRRVESKRPLVMPDLLPDVESKPSSVEDETVLVSARRLSVYPDSGRKQLLKIRMILQETEPGTPTFNLGQCFQMALGNLRSTRPLLIFITSVRPDTATRMREELIEALQQIGRVKNGERRLMIINISCFGLESQSEEDRLASRIFKLQEKRLLEEVFSDFRVINWDPTERTFVEALLAGGKI
jgi:uncharacterized protein (DUF58 family)